MSDAQIPELIRVEADGLWQRQNERLDSILNALRTDMLGRDAADDSISWLLNKRFMEEQVGDRFAKDLLIIALYRLARHEA